MAEPLGPPVGGDVNQAPTLIGVFGAMIGLSILCAAARVYTRFHLVRSPGTDDAVIVLCIVRILHQQITNLNSSSDFECDKFCRIDQSHYIRSRKTRILLEHRRPST